MSIPFASNHSSFSCPLACPPLICPMQCSAFSIANVIDWLEHRIGLSTSNTILYSIHECMLSTVFLLRLMNFVRWLHSLLLSVKRRFLFFFRSNNFIELIQKHQHGHSSMSSTTWISSLWFSSLFFFALQDNSILSAWIESAFQFQLKSKSEMLPHKYIAFTSSWYFPDLRVP